MDLTIGTPRELQAGPPMTLAVVDGLYEWHGSLIDVQNGLGIPRIAMFHLNASHTRVEDVRVLEYRGKLTDSPPTGAIAGNRLYFICNSQLNHLKQGQ